MQKGFFQAMMYKLHNTHQTFLVKSDDEPRIELCYS